MTVARLLRMRSLRLTHGLLCVVRGSGRSPDIRPEEGRPLSDAGWNGALVGDHCVACATIFVGHSPQVVVARLRGRTEGWAQQDVETPPRGKSPPIRQKRHIRHNLRTLDLMGEAIRHKTRLFREKRCPQPL